MKTSLKATFIILVSFMLSGCFYREDVFYDILKELNQISRRLDKIEHHLESKEYEARKKPPKRADKKSGKVDLVKLNAIKFPTDTSKESLRNYVFQVLSASKEQNRWSPKDPQVELLTKIGEENIDILIDFAKYKATWTRFYRKHAVHKLATERSRKIITDAISENRYLIKTILKNGWQGDVKEILIRDIENRVENLPKEWLKAASSFRDRSTYKALIGYFINCNYKYRTYEIIKDLPGIELQKPIIMAWNKVSKGVKSALDSYV